MKTVLCYFYAAFFLCIFSPSRQAPEADTCADIEFVLVVAGGHDLNDERIFEVTAMGMIVMVTGHVHSVAAVAFAAAVLLLLLLPLSSVVRFADLLLQPMPHPPNGLFLVRLSFR